MKTDLQVTGRVELTQHEISQAIIEYLGTHYNYKGKKVIYPGASESQQLHVIVEVEGTVEKDFVEKYEIRQKQIRQNEGGYRIVNKGVYETIRELLTEAFDKRTQGTFKAQVQFSELLKDIVDLYPKMDYNKLDIYLHDKRQFTNITYSSRDKVIIVSGKVNKQD